MSQVSPLEHPPMLPMDTRAMSAAGKTDRIILFMSCILL
jgi:hypothetical protein